MTETEVIELLLLVGITHTNNGEHLGVRLCGVRGHHSPFQWHRRRGPFWARRDEFRCVTCDQTVLAPHQVRVINAD